MILFSETLRIRSMMFFFSSQKHFLQKFGTISSQMRRNAKKRFESVLGNSGSRVDSMKRLQLDFCVLALDNGCLLLLPNMYTLHHKMFSHQAKWFLALYPSISKIFTISWLQVSSKRREHLGRKVSVPDFELSTTTWAAKSFGAIHPC